MYTIFVSMIWKTEKIKWSQYNWISANNLLYFSRSSNVAERRLLINYYYWACISLNHHFRTGSTLQKTKYNYFIYSASMRAHLSSVFKCVFVWIWFRNFFKTKFPFEVGLFILPATITFRLSVCKLRFYSRFRCCCCFFSLFSRPFTIFVSLPFVVIINNFIVYHTAETNAYKTSAQIFSANREKRDAKRENTLIRS